jgi:hypothetical protein
MPNSTKDTQRRLSETEKRAIISLIAAGHTQRDVAERFKVHVNTVQRLCADVRKNAPESALSSDWRREMNDELPPMAVSALKRSLADTDDPHKAADTASKVMKGLGHWAGDSTTNVQVAILNSIPPEWRDSMITTPTDDPVSD